MFYAVAVIGSTIFFASVMEDNLLYWRAEVNVLTLCVRLALCKNRTGYDSYHC
jgi:hypothetical protein